MTKHTINAAQQIHKFLSSAQFRGRDRPNNEILLNRLKRSLPGKLETFELLCVLQDWSDKLAVMVDHFLQSGLNPEEEQAYTAPLLSLKDALSPVKVMHVFNYEAQEANIRHLLIISPVLNVERKLVEQKIDPSTYLERFTQLIEEAALIGIEEPIKTRVLKLLRSSLTFYSEVESLGADLAWARLSEVLLIVMREANREEDERKKDWLVSAGRIAMAGLAGLAVVNAATDDFEQLGNKGQKLIESIFQDDAEGITPQAIDDGVT
ncbi:MAG: hypothetical protein AAGI14_08780 [Pseudomonadota bacterium]